MSLISSFNLGGAMQGGVAGGQAGGLYGAIGGAALGGFLGGGSSGTGYADPKVSGRGLGLQAQGVDYATAQRIKSMLKSGTINKAQLTQMLGGNVLRFPSGTPSAMSPLMSNLSATGAGSATALVGSGALTPIGQIIAGLGGAAGSFLAPSPAQTAANNATAIYRMLTGQSGGVVKKRRRMNPMNIRAARRAIRRIRGARKILMRIERSMPKARTHHRRTVR